MQRYRHPFIVDGTLRSVKLSFIQSLKRPPIRRDSNLSNRRRPGMLWKCRNTQWVPALPALASMAAGTTLRRRIGRLLLLQI